MYGHLAVLVVGLLTPAPRPQTPPVLFELNRGQAAANVLFLTRGASSSASIGADGTLSVSFIGGSGRAQRIAIVPLGARVPRLEAIDRQQAVLNILTGRDRSKWLRGVPLYSRVRASAIYPGIDIEYYGTGAHPEYDFVIAPGARPSAIRLRVEGGAVRLNPDGEFVVTTPDGTVRQPKPRAYQIVDGVRRDVAVSFRLEGSTLRFATGRYDESRPLVIDPLLVTSTYTGSATSTPVAGPVRSTATGLFVGGSANSDLYIAKYTLDGRTLLFETVFGGSGAEFFGDMAVDEQEGAIYAGGRTDSNDLPSIGYQVHGRSANRDVFLAKFSIDGSTVLQSTYIGTRNDDTFNGMALGDDLYVSMQLGFAESYLPTTPANRAGEFVGRFRRDGTLLRLQQMPGRAVVAIGPDRTPYIGATVGGSGLATAGAFQTTPGSSTCFVQLRVTGPCSDGLVAHYTVDLSARFWATYLRETTTQAGNAVDSVRSIAVDADGAVVVAGETLSTSFPVTPGAFDSVCNPCNPPVIGFAGAPPGVPFVTKVNPSGSGLIFSTFVNGNNSYSISGGPATDARVGGVSLDRLGSVLLSGTTWNPSFAAVGTPLPQAASPDATNPDAFLTVFAPAGNVSYSSRFGGTGADTGTGVVALPFGTVALGGDAGPSFPLQNPVKTSGTSFLAIVAVPRIYTVLDVPLPSGLTRASSVTIRGWAVDTSATSNTGIDSVAITATPSSGGAPISLGTATLGEVRSDVALALGGANFTNSGFSLTTSLPAGQYTISAIAHSSVSNTTGAAATAQVTARAGTVSKIQVPSAGPLPAGTRTLTLSGFAVDLDASTGTGVDAVHAWAYPASGAPFFLGVANYGETRSDLTDMFGAQFTSGGFSLSAPMQPGIYTIAAHAHSTVTGTFSAVDTVTISVPSPTTELHVDVPSGPSLYQGFTIGGWAIDRYAPISSSGVDAIHVWAFPLAGGSPIFLGSATTFIARADVAVLHGARALMSGFSVKTASVPPGDYQVVSYARTTMSQQFDAVDSRKLTVLAAAGTVIQIKNIPDNARVNGETTYTGYAFDPRAATGLGVDAVHVYLYPNWGSGAPAEFVGLATYGTGGDPSIGAQFGDQFTGASLSQFVSLPPGPGTHLLVFYAHSTVDDTFTPVTRLVTVPPAQLLLSIDRPQPNAVFSGSFVIGGWAIDRANVDVPGDGNGVEFLQIYAYPVAGGPPVLVCGPWTSAGQNGSEKIPRSDVAAAFGPRFLHSGFDCGVNFGSGAPQLAPGTYDLAVYMFSSRTRQYSPPTVVRFTVQ